VATGVLATGVAATVTTALPGQAAASEAAASEAAAAKNVPKLREMVVFRSGAVLERRVRPKRTRVRVEGRRCGIGARTPLAALKAIRPGRTVLEDFGSCSRRPRDAGGLYVKRLRGEGERGSGGWVYKVDRRTPGVGAADPSWRLRRSRRVLWFWCVQSSNCQRSLELRATAVGGGQVEATVTGYDDNGDGERIEAATVTIGSVEATTDSSGVARATLAPGRYRIWAEKPGLVRSFTGRVVVE
jgi:hypothetical protein